MQIPPALRSGAGCTLAVALIAIHLQLAAAVAQSATGGSIGKQDKSVSGGEESSPSRSRSTERSRQRSDRSSSHGGGDPSSYDGRYSMNAVGNAGCNGQKSGSSELVISGGRASETGFQLAVSGSGSMRGSFNQGNVVGSLSGRISGSAGSGIINLTNGCKISFTLSKK